MKKNKNFSLWKYLKQHTLSIVLYLLLNLVATACTVVATILTANSIEFVTLKVWHKAISTMVIVLSLIALQRVCWWLTNIIYNKTLAKFTQTVSADLASRAFKLDSSTYANHNSGTFVQRIIEDPSKILINISAIFNGLTEFLSGVIVFFYIASLNIWLSLLLIVLIGICIILEAFRIRSRKIRSYNVQKKRDKVYSLTNEIVKSEKDIKSMGLEDKLSEESKKFYSDYQKSFCKNNNIDTNYWGLRNFLVDCGTYAILIWGIVFIRKELISLATYMIIYSNKNSLLSTVVHTGNIGNWVTEIKIATKRISALFDEKEFVTEKFGNIELPLSSGGGRITFSHVQYGYENKDYEEDAANKKDRKNKASAASTTKNKIFDDLSFEIQPNTTVAFVGKSGSGKSTILNLMSKLYRVDGGEILIDGVNINDLTKESLRRTISLVNQFPYIFNMSIKENLLLAKKDASDNELLTALQDADLKEFVLSLPKGIDTIVGEGGIRLSGGQRQRLAIARALLRNSSIIIFDESTSSLDNFSQEEIKKSVDALKGKSTIVIVAHRLSTIKNVDHIFFLDEGKIIDEGNFVELFNKNKKFRTMFMAENL